MARTVAAAWAAAAGPELDAALGLDWTPPSRTPVDPQIEAAFAELGSEPLRRMVRQLASGSGRQPGDAEDAVQDALLKLFVSRRDLFSQRPESWLGLLYETARYRLRGFSRRRRVVSIEALKEDGREALIEEAEPCIALTHHLSEEGGRPVRGPEEEWTYDRIVAAIERFRDYTGRPPKSSDCKALNGLPSMTTIYKHFASLSEAVLAAGMTPESPFRRRTAWGPLEAAQACASFRRRNGRWPDAEDARRWPGDLPGAATMLKYFGGTRSSHVQRGAEVILAAAARREGKAA